MDNLDQLLRTSRTGKSSGQSKRLPQEGFVCIEMSATGVPPRQAGRHSRHSPGCVLHTLEENCSAPFALGEGSALSFEVEIRVRLTHPAGAEATCPLRACCWLSHHWLCVRSVVSSLFVHALPSRKAGPYTGSEFRPWQWPCWSQLP